MDSDVCSFPTSASSSEIRDGMRVDWDVPIRMDDGAVLRADVFRPVEQGRYPALMTYGPYSKGLSFQQGYPTAWKQMADNHPDVTSGSTNLYQNWEVVDPEKWVPDGYACVRVDSRGAGASQGKIEPWSPREAKDYHDCIEWAADQPWCSGKVGLAGVSYYGINQWQVASLQPPSLAAICIWEGASDFYRDMSYHGGILCTFLQNWYDMQVKTVQHGLGSRGRRSLVTNQPICGTHDFSDEELQTNRTDLGADVRAHPFDDSYHRLRSPNWDQVTVPLLSAGNWGGQGLHLRGNVEGFLNAKSPHKWLELHGREHWTEFYTDYGRNLQKRFFGHFLKGENTGWAEQPKVLLQVRHVDGSFEQRAETAWPLPGTRWTKVYLSPTNCGLTDAPAADQAELSFDAMGDGLTFLSAPLEKETEITGPSAVKLFASSTTADADIFVVVRVFAPDHREIVFQGAIDPHTPIGQGWLRVSHRKLDPARTLPYRPFHAHDQRQPLSPGEIAELDIEIWPTSVVVPAGYRIGLSVRGRDYAFGGGSGGRQSNFKNEMTGCGPFLHDETKTDRVAGLFDGVTSLHFGENKAPYLLLPIIPSRHDPIHRGPE